VADLPDGREAGAIVRAVVSLATSLGMVTTAEGVETWPQLESLRYMGIDQVQGFLLSRAVPAAEVPLLIQRLRGMALLHEPAVSAHEGLASSGSCTQ
jgi:EAL domain-containing protein (putative c-di-GMP-specific phosphodiesterase class I)